MVDTSNKALAALWEFTNIFGGKRVVHTHLLAVAFSLWMLHCQVSTTKYRSVFILHRLAVHKFDASWIASQQRRTSEDLIDTIRCCV